MMASGLIKAVAISVFLSFGALVSAISWAGGVKEPVTILAFGDSLTAGYGLYQGESLPDQIETALAAEGIEARLVNAGVSGDTTSGGRARLLWTLEGMDAAPDLVILALGANDGLRGIDPSVTRANLDHMLETLQDRGIPVLLAGMLAPPNMGSEYADEFNPIFPELADEYDVTLYPFLLDGVAAEPALNQGDGMHPNAEGVAVMVERMVPVVIEALEVEGE